MRIDIEAHQRASPLHTGPIARRRRRPPRWRAAEEEAGGRAAAALEALGRLQAELIRVERQRPGAHSHCYCHHGRRRRQPPATATAAAATSSRQQHFKTQTQGIMGAAQMCAAGRCPEILAANCLLSCAMTGRWRQHRLKVVRHVRRPLAPDETVILLPPPLPLVGLSIVMVRERQQNDSLVNG